MCFSKGLGAPIGSIIVGSVPFIKHARRIRKSIGGGTRQAGIIAAAARVAVEESFGKGPWGEGGKLRACHTRAKKIGETWRSKGGKLTNPTETNMVWLDLEAAGCRRDEFVELAKEVGLKMLGGRLVVHYQISDDAITRLEKLMDRLLQHRPAQNGQ
jgi:threonine aldolase